VQDSREMLQDVKQGQAQQDHRQPKLVKKKEVGLKTHFLHVPLV
jgi:hypothetical protein